MEDVITQRKPTAEEFEAARTRELARLNLRLTSDLGKPFHTPEEEGLLRDDTPYDRWSDMETIRRWAARPVEHGEKGPNSTGLPTL